MFALQNVKVNRISRLHPLLMDAERERNLIFTQKKKSLPSAIYWTQAYTDSQTDREAIEVQRTFVKAKKRSKERLDIETEEAHRSSKGARQMHADPIAEISRKLLLLLRPFASLLDRLKQSSVRSILKGTHSTQRWSSSGLCPGLWRLRLAGT